MRVVMIGARSGIGAAIARAHAAAGAAFRMPCRDNRAGAEAIGQDGGRANILPGHARGRHRRRRRGRGATAEHPGAVVAPIPMGRLGTPEDCVVADLSLATPR